MDVIRISIIAVAAVAFTVVMVIATVNLIKDAIAMSRYKRKCKNQADAIIKRLRLTSYKGGKYKHRDAKATYEFELNGETVTGRDRFYGLYFVKSPGEGDAVKVKYDPTSPKHVYGYYSARGFRRTILYLVDFLLIEAVLITAVVVMIMRL